MLTHQGLMIRRLLLRKCVSRCIVVSTLFVLQGPFLTQSSHRHGGGMLLHSLFTLVEMHKTKVRLPEEIEEDAAVVSQWREHRRPVLTPLHLGIGAAPLKFKTPFRNTIYSVLIERGWKETSDEVEWHVLWAGKDWVKHILPKIHLHAHQLINHFRNYYELTRKDLLVKNLKRARVQYQRAGDVASAEKLDFFPETYNLPSEYLLFVDAFRRQQNENNRSMWIAKPIGSSQGRGIFLFDKLSAIARWAEICGSSGLQSTTHNINLMNGREREKEREKEKEEKVELEEYQEGVERYIVQRYVHKPLLIGGKKFDIRIYVLVTNYEPLNIYVHREAFARFSTQRYEPYQSTNRLSDINNNFMHLTNVAIQKEGEDYDELSGGKMNIAALKRYLFSLHPDETTKITRCFHLITELILYSLLSVKPLMIKDPHCFELYGYDVLVDSSFKPWLIEVNASPSLSANTSDDEALKKAMLHDCFHVLDFERWCTNYLRDVTKANNSAKSKREVKNSAVSTKASQQQCRSIITSTDNNSFQPTSKFKPSFPLNNDFTPASLRDLFLSGSFDRIGGFDCIFRENYGGLRLDAQGGAINCIGHLNQRKTALVHLWTKMDKFDDDENKRLEALTTQAVKAAEERSQARDKRRNKLKG